MEKSNIKYPILKLRKGKDEALNRFHPWIFSGAFQKIPNNLTSGSLVYVTDFQDNIIATGCFENENIAVKVLDFKANAITSAFWTERLKAALELRHCLGLTAKPETNAFRLIHSEGDLLPGLIIDIYGQTAVIQTQSNGMAILIIEIRDALLEVMSNRLKAIYWKKPKVSSSEIKSEEGYLFGNECDREIIENGLRFNIDIENGQKTGFFLDQRENRLLLQSFSANRKVLNTFSYSGGFSVAALAGGAQSVVSVDSSTTAISLCDQNIAINSYSGSQHTSVVQDAKKFLEEMQRFSYDLIILDPPAFAKNHHNRHKGLLGYRYLNSEALKKIAPKGILFTFSCSQAIDFQSFQSIVMAAAIDARREVKILHRLSQPPDHPVNIFQPEGSYLKGLVLSVD